MVGHVPDWLVVEACALLRLAGSALETKARHLNKPIQSGDCLFRANGSFTLQVMSSSPLLPHDVDDDDGTLSLTIAST